MCQGVWRPLSETNRTYMLIAATLVAMLLLGVLAVRSGAIDALNASGFLGGRS